MTTIEDGHALLTDKQPQPWDMPRGRHLHTRAELCLVPRGMTDTTYVITDFDRLGIRILRTIPGLSLCIYIQLPACNIGDSPHQHPCPGGLYFITKLTHYTKTAIKRIFYEPSSVYDMENMELNLFGVIAIIFLVIVYFLIALFVFGRFVENPKHNPDGWEARWVPSILWTEACLRSLWPVAYTLPAALWPVFAAAWALLVVGRALRAAPRAVWEYLSQAET